MVLKHILNPDGDHIVGVFSLAPSMSNNCKCMQVNDTVPWRSEPRLMENIGELKGLFRFRPKKNIDLKIT